MLPTEIWNALSKRWKTEVPIEEESPLQITHDLIFKESQLDRHEFFTLFSKLDINHVFPETGISLLSYSIANGGAGRPIP